jgi:CRISPR-associated endoribonuclease Cas6
VRLHLTIRPLTQHCSLSLNYPYYLSSAIYHWIEQSSPAYSHFLHEQGFSPEHVTRKFRHFCFSRLAIPRRDTQSQPGRIVILSPTIDWYVSMAVEESLRHFVTGVFEKQEFFIEREEFRFGIEQVEALPDPVWKERMRFRMLSPTTVSVPEVRNGKLTPTFLYHDDERLSGCLRDNMLNKYASLYGASPEDTRFTCTIDNEFAESQHRKGRTTDKLITVRERRGDETKIRGFLCPLTIEGNAELIRLAYMCGLGEKNSMGFGMVEATQ